MDSFQGLDDRFHCGSHYSNPGIVLHYLSRLSPFLEASLILQSYQLDNPDRIFHSIEHSFKNALTDFSDVRELTPEFYTSPNLFKNSNLLNYGVKQDSTQVDDVLLPVWADNDPQKFVRVMREALESVYVSQNLDMWIDYIFGCK